MVPGRDVNIFILSGQVVASGLPVPAPLVSPSMHTARGQHTPSLRCDPDWQGNGKERGTVFLLTFV